MSFSELVAQTQIPLPAHSSVYTGNVRGYWFQAPTCFTITGAMLPTDAGTGAQNIAIIRLPAAPPAYSTTTSTFTTLFLTQNNPNSGVLPMNIQVQAGDFIGVLGQRATANSYAGGSYASNVAGNAMTLERLGMQFQLGTTAPQQVWTEIGGSISRCFLYYDSTLTFNLSSTQTGPTSFDFDNGADSSITTTWDFGDGNTSNVNNPSHTYASDGTYNVCTIINTTCGIDTLCTTLIVCGAPTSAAFVPSTSGLTVSFTDSSTNAASYSWDFGDGSTDTTANPSHTYANVGWYNVCLMTTSPCGAMDTLCDSILVCANPIAGINSTNMGGGVYGFNDNSSFGSSYFWDFGDGTTDTTQNAMHSYGSDGSYTVCLIVSNICGSDTICETVTACVTALSSAFSFTSLGFDYTFTDMSTGASSYMWDFGDGNTSTSASPMHTYGAHGNYNACLTVWNACGDSSTTCDSISVFVIGVENAMSGFDISISPNPMTNQAAVMVQNAAEQGEFSLELYNVLGAKVRTEKGSLNTKMIVERNGLSTGMYIFKIRQNDQILGTGRLILE